MYLDRDLITMRYWRQSGDPGFTNGNWTNSSYADSYTGLYGQTWEQAGYTGWPPPGDGYIWNYYNNSNGTTVRTFLGQFVLAGTERQPAGIGVGNQEVRYYKTASNTYTVQFFLQNTDGSTYPDTTPYVGVGGRGGQFSFTEKFDGFTLDQYRVQTPNGWSNWQTATNGGSVYFSNNLQVRYKRLSYTLKFLDARNGTELLDVPSVEVVYGAALSDSRPQNINDPEDLTSPSPELVWTGKWYADQECTTEFDWSRTMPNHDIAVYVNWDVLWYWIKIDPDGGALRNTESTWVWKVKGDYVEEYHNVVRKFSEDPDGEYYYHYDEFNENDPHGTQPSTRRAEYLPISGNPNWQEDSYDGKRYKPDQSMYPLSAGMRSIPRPARFWASITLTAA